MKLRCKPFHRPTSKGQFCRTRKPT